MCERRKTNHLQSWQFQFIHSIQYRFWFKIDGFFFFLKIYLQLMWCSHWPWILFEQNKTLTETKKKQIVLSLHLCFHMCHILLLSLSKLFLDSFILVDGPLDWNWNYSNINILPTQIRHLFMRRWNITRACYISTHSLSHQRRTAFTLRFTI